MASQPAAASSPVAAKPSTIAASSGAAAVARPGATVAAAGAAVQQPQRRAAGADAADSSAASALFAGAMPREETGAAAFLQAHPEYDGRGVVVCIFDTGVDPAAEGLQTTPDGRPKIIDVLDCTGSGDVDTSKVVKADAAGCIPGLSGRALAPNPAWANPSGDWRVGLAPLYRLFPRGLTSRVREERRKRFDQHHRAALAAASASLADFDQDKGLAAKLGEADKRARAELEGRLAALQEAATGYEDCGPMADAVVWHDGSCWRAALDTTGLLGSGAVTPGASQEAAAAAGSQGCALADHRALTNFRAERQHAVFGAHDVGCTYALNIYDGGASLSVVVDAGAHGTHVAGIVAAHYPGDPASDGVAPGAQIISCKIGDSRLGSMETGTGLVRAMIAARQAGVDVVNMSYGEPTATPNRGRIIELAAELVDKHGVVFVASAGNAGPALSTVGAPGGTTSALFSVGAYVSPALAQAGHSVRNALPAGQQYTWSSRGPAQDGHVGVMLSAPGGAIAPVPAHTMQRRQLMNGTSMSSPNAAGCVALLLSGLKAEGQACSPARLRRALENTCMPLGGDAADAVLTYGRGLIQVPAAWQYLHRSREADALDIRYQVTVSGGAGGEQRGIYMREPHEAQAPASFTVAVRPTLHEDAPNSAKLAVEERLELESSAPGWLACPPLLLLHHNGRGFEVRLDPTGLAPGLHYAEVRAYDAAARWRGPLFRLPVTVVKPEQLPAPGAPDTAAEQAAGSATAVVEAGPTGSQAPGGGAAAAPGGVHAAYTLDMGQLSLRPGQELRQFVAVPTGASWAEVQVRGGAFDSPRTFLLRATQLAPHMRYTDTEWRQTLTLSPGSEWQAAFKVLGGGTLELTVAQFWSSLGDSSLELEVAFFGIGLGDGGSGAPGTALALRGADGTTKVMVTSPLRRQRVKPEAKLTDLAIPLAPSEATIQPLSGERDGLTSGRVIYTAQLTYKLAGAEAGKYTARLPLANGYLYDSPLEAQFCQLFDANKRLLYQGDAYPDEVALAKGDYSLCLLLRHDSRDLLDRLKAVPLVMTRKLGSAITLPAYPSHAAAVTGGSQAGECYMNAGERMPLFLGPLPPDTKLPKDATPGRTLTGQLVLCNLKRGSGPAPFKVPLTYVVGPAAAAGAGGDKEAGAAVAAGDAAKPAPDLRLAEALRDARIKALAELSLDGGAEQALFDRLAAEVAAEHPGHLPLLTAVLKKLDGQPEEKRGQQLGAIVAAADAVLAAIDTTELAVFQALRAPDEDPAAGQQGSAGTAAGDAYKAAAGGGGDAGVPAPPSYKERKKAMDGAKAALLDALSRKLKAQLDASEPAPGAAGDAAAVAPSSALPAPLPADARATWAALRQWVDTAAEADYALLHARVEARQGRYASALKALAKPAAGGEGKAASKEAAALRAHLYARLGWAHLAEREAVAMLERFPAAYPRL